MAYSKEKNEYIKTSELSVGELETLRCLCAPLLTFEYLKKKIYETWYVYIYRGT
jgi:hypothetical protein